MIYYYIYMLIFWGMQGTILRSYFKLRNRKLFRFQIFCSVSDQISDRQ
jgi:hypothetical protein